MVRLMLVLAPIMCILGGIAISSTLANYVGNMDLFGKSKATDSTGTSVGGGKSASKGGKHHKEDNYPYKNEVILTKMNLLIQIVQIDSHWSGFGNGILPYYICVPQCLGDQRSIFKSINCPFRTFW